MDLYKLFLIFYRTKPIKKVKPKNLIGNHIKFKPFIYDLVSDPGFTQIKFKIW